MGKKALNPADQYRKEEKKKAAKKNAKVKATIREVNDLLNNPQKIQEQIEQVQKDSDENRLDKGLKDKIKELKMMKNVAIKKQMTKDALTGGAPRDKDSSQSAASASARVPAPAAAAPAPAAAASASAPPAHVAPAPRRRDESIYFHPQFNPSGAPPPGQPMMYRAQQAGAPAVPAPAPAPAPQAYQHQAQYSSAPRPRGPASIPFPPPPRHPVMGGLNGVPLPPPPPLPPRPMGPPGGFAPRGPPTAGLGYGGPPSIYGPGGPGGGPGGRGGQGQMPQRGHDGGRGRGQRRKQHAAADVDPLDPGASGYNTLLAQRPNQRPNQNVHKPPVVAPAVDLAEAQAAVGPALAPALAPAPDDEVAGPAIPPPMPAEAPSALSAEELMRERYMMPDEGAYDEEEYEEQEGSDQGDDVGPTMPPGAGVAPLSAEELMRRRYMMPDEGAYEEEEDDEYEEEMSGPVPGPSMPVPMPMPMNIEEIMRRRNQITDADGGDGTAPSGPSFPAAGPGPAPGPVPGPMMYPEAGPAPAGGAGAEWSYYPTAEDVYGEEDEQSRSDDAGGDNSNSNAAGVEKAPVKNVLQMFSSYGESDEDSDNDDGTNDKPSGPTDQGNMATTRPSVDPYSQQYIRPDIYNTGRTENAEPAAAAGQYPTTGSGGDGGSQGPAGAEAAAVSAPPTPKPLAGPKIVKMDSELTGFVPAALRVKRQMAGNSNASVTKKAKLNAPSSSSSSSSAPNGVLGQVETKASWVAQSSVSTAPTRAADAAPGASVDSAYADFMKEIEELNEL
jgi:hypothetical protein